MFDLITAAIVNSEIVTLGYVKPSGVLTVRTFKPYSITRCGNGNTTLNGICPHDDHPKSLSYAGIKFAMKGDEVAGVTSDIIQGWK